MKTLYKILVITVAIALAPASAFAIVDIAGYGGYTTGEYQKVDYSGPEYGAVGHLNYGIPMLIDIGIGAFYQRTSYEIEQSGFKYKGDRDIVGLDAIATLELPIIVHPYVRGGIAFRDQLKSDAGDKLKDNFKTYHAGVGAGITIFPMLRLFAEYIYTSAELKKDSVKYEIYTHSVHAGVKLSL